MPLKHGRVDGSNLFYDQQDKHWRVSRSHPAAPAPEECDLTEYQGRNVTIEYDVESDPWLLGVGEIVTS